MSAQLYEQHIARLASDEFEGRKPATRGEEKTLAYLTDAFTRIGLDPAVGSSYLQPVPLVEITAGSDARLEFAGRPGVPRLEYPRNVVLWTKRTVPAVDVAGSPLVFVGYGVVAPEFGWNDYAGIDMRGKTAVILINDPGFATGDESLFRGRALTYYGRWTYKFEEAARQGATGAIIVHQTEPAAYGWETVVNSWTGPQL
ncbi:MAG: peptidase M28, partial [Steroidobacteraceae bacterium]